MTNWHFFLTEFWTKSICFACSAMPRQYSPYCLLGTVASYRSYRTGTWYGTGRENAKLIGLCKNVTYSEKEEPDFKIMPTRYHIR